MFYFRVRVFTFNDLFSADAQNTDGDTRKSVTKVFYSLESICLGRADIKIQHKYLRVHQYNINMFTLA